MTDDAIGGATRGLALASLFCIWATVQYVLQGQEMFARKHVTYGTVVAAYLVIGLIAGAVVGGARRFATSEGRSFLVGLGGGIPIAVGLVTAVYGLPSMWPPSTRLFLPVYSIGAAWFIGTELEKGRAAREAASSQPGAEQMFK